MPRYLYQILSLIGILGLTVILLLLAYYKFPMIEAGTLFWVILVCHVYALFILIAAGRQLIEILIAIFLNGIILAGLAFAGKHTFSETIQYILICLIISPIYIPVLLGSAVNLMGNNHD